MRQPVSVESEQQARQSSVVAVTQGEVHAKEKQQEDFIDNREETIAKRQLMADINASAKLALQRKTAASFHNSPRMTAQRQQYAAMKSPVSQLETKPDEAMLQGKYGPARAQMPPAMQIKSTARSGNSGMMPPSLKSNPIQRKPSTFAPTAKEAVKLKPGKGSGSKKIRGLMDKVDVFNVLSTPWTYLQRALNNYIQLQDDPVTDEHLKAITEVQRRINAWKKSHKTNVPNIQLSEDEQVKLTAVTKIEALLDDEFQYARKPKTAPEDMPGIVAERLKFIFEDTLGESFLEEHSKRTWKRFMTVVGNFDKRLLQKELPQKQDIDKLDAPTLAKLAGVRVETLRGNEGYNTKIALYAVQCLMLANTADLEVDSDKALGPSAQWASLDLVENELSQTYPALAKDIALEIKQQNILGVNLISFLKKAAESFTQSKDTFSTVQVMQPQGLKQLQQEILEAPEYQELVKIAKVHAKLGNTGKDLPQAENEDLASREKHLLKTLKFELQEQDAAGKTTKKGLNVPDKKKAEVVMAVMTVEKLAGKQFGRYPDFILIRKQGGQYRANADAENRYIRYDIDFTMRTAVHELGHYYENQAKLEDWYAVYLLMRSRHAGEAKRLGVAPDKTYGSSVIGAPDEPGFLGGIKGLEHRYMQEYTARYYQTGHTEMMSMFTERLIDKQQMDAVIQHDPQAFAILLKTLRPGALPKWPLQRLGYT